MKKIFCALLLLSAGLTYADSTPTNSDGNVYFDIGLGAAKTDNLPTGAAAVNMNWGYNFNRGLALEAGWTAMPSKQWGHLDNYNIYDVAAKGTIPMGKTFDLYGRLGVAGAYSSWTGTCANSDYYNQGSAWGMVGLVGVGASFNLDPSYSLYLENNNYIPFGGAKGSFGYTSALLFGFQYNFGQSSKSQANQPVTSATYPSDTSGMNNGQIVTADHGAADIGAGTIVTADIAAVGKESSESVTMISPAYESRIFTDQSGRYLVVQKGDNLYNISCGVDVYVTTLQTKNNLKGNIIKIGNKLYLDEPHYIPQSEYDRFNQRIHTEGNRRYFEAICGDDLLNVSRLSGVSVQTLSKINNIKNANRILVGSKVYLDEAK